VSYPVKEIRNNILSVVAGVIVTLMVVIPIIIIYGLLGFTILSFCLLFIGIFAGIVLGGYVTGRFSTRNTTIHTIITGIILVLISLWNSDSKMNPADIDYVTFLFIISLTWMGGYMAQKKRKQKIDKLGSRLNCVI
jgi:hypothetical protein